MNIVEVKVIGVDYPNKGDRAEWYSFWNFHHSFTCCLDDRTFLPVETIPDYVKIAKLAEAKVDFIPFEEIKDPPTKWLDSILISQSSFNFHYWRGNESDIRHLNRDNGNILKKIGGNQYSNEHKEVYFVNKRKGCWVILPAQKERAKGKFRLDYFSLLEEKNLAKTQLSLKSTTSEIAIVGYVGESAKSVIIIRRDKQNHRTRELDHILHWLGCPPVLTRRIEDCRNYCKHEMIDLLRIVANWVINYPIIIGERN